MRQEDMTRYGISALYRTNAFDAAGVLPGFSQIEAERLYDLLVDLPQRDPNGALAKSVYQAVLVHFTDAKALDCAARKTFFRQGRILARCGNEHRYCELKKTWHLNTDDLPPALRDNLCIAEIPKSARSTRVRDLFGVKTIERRHIARRIHLAIVSTDASEADEKIRRLKPLIAYLRRAQTQRQRDKSAFNDLEIRLCSAIEGEVEFQGVTVPLDLRVWN